MKKYSVRYLSSPKEIRATALRYLDKRHYSANGLRQKLFYRLDPEKKEELSDALDEIIANLIEKKLIDEEKMLESWVYYRQEHVPRGKSFVERELLQKGVDPDILSQKLPELYDEDTEYAILLKVFNKEVAKEPVDEEKKARFWCNLINRLGRKGFKFDKIYDLTEKYRSIQ